MGRANVYLTDDLERRVKAAQLPISEICQRALLAAVEAAEGSVPGFGESLSRHIQRGWEAGVRWTHTAPPASLLTLLRDQRLEDVPAETLPDDLYSMTRDQTLAWEAGFMAAARATIRLPVPASHIGDPDAHPSEPEEDFDSTGPTDSPGLGDDANCRIGLTIDGDPVSFDPHAALRKGKSPLFAVLGEPEHRARLALSVAQDAASRGLGVVLLDLSGHLTSRATGLGRNVRVVRRPQAPMPGLEDLLHGAVGLGGLWETIGSLSRGSGLADFFGDPREEGIEPGYVTVIGLPRENQIGAALSTLQVLTQFRSQVDFPRLLHVDLPEGVNVPGGLTSRLGGIARIAREQNVAVGLSAASADSVGQIAGGGAPLSTVIAFATNNPVEADRLRTLMGRAAPILVNPPGASTSPSDETWAVMRDLEGRFGQVRMQGW